MSSYDAPRLAVQNTPIMSLPHGLGASTTATHATTEATMTATSNVLVAGSTGRATMRRAKTVEVSSYHRCIEISYQEKLWRKKKKKTENCTCMKHIPFTQYFMRKKPAFLLSNGFATISWWKIFHVWEPIADVGVGQYHKHPRRNTGVPVRMLHWTSISKCSKDTRLKDATVGISWAHTSLNRQCALPKEVPRPPSINDFLILSAPSISR